MTTTAPLNKACDLILFGTKGDLARRKLLPALYQLEKSGLLHADSPFDDWSTLRTWLELDDDPDVLETCLWSRRRLKQADTTPVKGLRALLVGHTTVQSVRQLGNVWHLDTGGWTSGHFSLMDLRTLMLVNASPA